jgi:O-succinylbenzoate synthase
VPGRHPIGVIDEAGAEREAAWLETHGILAVKVKVEPGRDVAPVRVLRAALPYLDIGVDANGGYDHPDDPALAALDRLEVSFIEQPFPAEDLAAHSALRSTVRMAVCLDESVPDLAGVERAIAAGAADQVSVKLNRSGLEALGATLSLCREAGIGVQIGGTFDTSIGRRHLLAAATLPGVVDAAVGPPSAYLKRDVASYPALVDGLVAPEDVPGMGGEPDITELDLAAIRRV